MNRPSRHRIVIVNLLVSLAISLIVNFSYFVQIIVSNQSAQPSRMPHAQVTWLQVLWVFVMAFILVSIATYSPKRKDVSDASLYIRKLVICITVAVVLYFLTPYTSRSGELKLMIMSKRMFNPMIMLKSSFTLIVALLYGKIFELVYQKQHMEIENQKLKNENLQTTYNMLMGQINPHFFFNSLNSLSMLVRENDNERALTYIDRLSDTFRYIIQNGQKGTTTLKEELDFLDAYKYLLEIRYANKLFFNIKIEKGFKAWLLPTLSLLPLIENAVKHNSITTARPFTVSIYTEGEYVVISNPLIPKIEKTDGTGIGLKNLSSRYMLLTGKDIEQYIAEGTFYVKLPLIEA